MQHLRTHTQTHCQSGSQHSQRLITTHEITPSAYCCDEGKKKNLKTVSQIADLSYPRKCKSERSCRVRVDSVTGQCLEMTIRAVPDF